MHLHRSFLCETLAAGGFLGDYAGRRLPIFVAYLGMCCSVVGPAWVAWVAWVSEGHFLKNSFLRQKKMRRAEQFVILMGQARFGDGKPLCSEAPCFPVG